MIQNTPILLDQEGGRVNRLTNFLNNDLSTSEFFGNLYSKDRKIFNVKYNEFITETANHLKLIGVNLNTVPVLDLRLKGSSSIIGDRSFSHDPKVVSRIGDICIENFHKNKIGTIMKHIPGHGLAKVDSHKLTPTIKQNLKYLSKKDFIPFKNKRCLFGMTAHIVYSHIDKVYTATHSKKVIDIIRKKIKFQNILLSDDISMKSLKFSIKDNTIKAFSAGCDLVLHCNGNLKEMKAVAINSPFLNKFIIKNITILQNYKLIFGMSINDSKNFNVDLDNYQGPLDILLDLAKAQKVNLEDISITLLADQFHNYIKSQSNLNLEVASEYLLMATWLTYLKSKLLLPGNPEEEFKVLEVAEKLKLQLKKLELIRLLSDQMLKRKRLGREIRLRGIKGNIRSIYSTEYKLNLYELLKSYSSIIMTKDFQRMNIPKLPVFTTEDGIKRIKEFFGKLIDWKNINDLIPSTFKSGLKYKRTGKAGIFAGSLELVKEGNLTIKQDNLFDEIYVKEIK